MIGKRLLLTLCLGTLAPAWGQSADPDALPPEMHGLWRSEGYNLLVHVTADEATTYHVSRGASVLESRQDHADFLRRNRGPALVAPDRLMVPSGLLPGYRYYYRRVQDLPGPGRYFGRGETPASRDAVANFDVFWNTFDEYYAYFDVRGVDWDAVRAQWRPRIQASNDEATLKEALASIVRQVGDRHVVLATPTERIQADAIPLQSRTAWLHTEQKRNPAAREADFRPLMTEHIRRNVLGGRGKEGANGRLVWGRLDNGVGYLGFLSCSGVGEDAIHEALDQVLADLGDTPAMVVDIRTNGGGRDNIGLAVVSRFADRQRLAFTKQARIGGGLGEGQPIHVAPVAGRASYVKPTYVLTSDSTASAAEITTLGFMALPHVTLAGAPTMGIFSDMLGARLPNGWRFTLSNEVYTAPNGRSYEGPGVPPALALPYEVEGDFYRGFDQAIATVALRALKQSR